MTAAVTALAGPPAVATPGCEAADFAGFPAGNIALISRGVCMFAVKATNAYNAGAVGAIICDNVPREFNGTLGNGFTLNIPVTQAVGQQLASTPGLVMRLEADAFRGFATTANVLADSRDGNDGNAVMAGAKLDSVSAGPGINDNGSGVAALLEVVQQMAKVKPINKGRFAFWGAMESGLVGTNYYVDGLAEGERAKIPLYLNFDMIGSPSHVSFVCDGDDSDGVGAGPGPAGSAAIEKTFEAFYAARGLPFKGTDLSGLSDNDPFVAVGIPSGGIITGAEGIKTVEEAALWGGTAGQQYDLCYHRACDTYNNVGLSALETNADAVAYAVPTYTMSSQDVNGQPGKGNFKPQGRHPRRGACAGPAALRDVRVRSWVRLFVWGMRERTLGRTGRTPEASAGESRFSVVPWQNWPEKVAPSTLPSTHAVQLLADRRASGL